jgi:ribosome-associated toxin RatA of RatAB toxin-antitoxin module
MSLIQGSASTEIPASIETCWAVVEDLPAAPSWQNGLEELTVVERGDDGRPLFADTVTDAKFRKVACRVRFDYDAPHRLTFTRVSGDVKVMEGSWELEELGPQRTRATYTMAVDPGKVGLLAKPLEKGLRPLIVGGRPGELAREVLRRG